MAKKTNVPTKPRTVNQLIKAIASGGTTVKDLRKRYAELRSVAQKRIQRIEKSDMPFTRGTKPYFKKTGNIIGEREIVRELATLEYWLTSERSTMKGRKALRKRTLASLHESGFDWVNESNFRQFTEFMTWFRASEYSAKYDSNADIVEDIGEYAIRNNVTDWEALFKEFSELYTTGGSAV